ncbi:hypothetical protein PISMIDRAFT_265281 [Pisolithus microcarpus 441]|uniref:Uncharacterized protein n=1 Tax=Pisolithus microcarpus 441 TaxID=765257 RepID=A0A0C9YRS4_9AGAM|nr:hypothetical protein BKA83DRAFT_265281 [Pisolithus microcarpus]KIK16539.1 hypothetical protein PISMIDRAFT_265281 [Pisolithus microcarpus 441]
MSPTRSCSFISITTLVGIRHPLHLYPPNHTVARNCIRNISLNSWPITSPFLLAVMEIFQVFAVGVALDEFLNIITSNVLNSLLKFRVDRPCGWRSAPSSTSPLSSCWILH